ncbi:MAG TPA: hypothetical protein VFM29_03950 [Vicinamibacteria bacterium]|nr:hypothetical protein [Vicinamibacteria bacterium]
MAGVMLTALLALELARWASPAAVRLDRRPAVARDPFPADDHADHAPSTR